MSLLLMGPEIFLVQGKLLVMEKVLAPVKMVPAPDYRTVKWPERMLKVPGDMQLVMEMKLE